ncbi:hypothetical protein EGC79_11045 [Shewanella vesiculosa]|uniref:DUF6602 domain-containing protein n=1 Tax=Shewanella vesiculosa TaxID=518738 RepID=UPI000F4E4FEF|nr:DUF6602 domain-containing protein [Shewanella vesiculosa]RPA50620.1 hypothetical protein EGC79_11045 [Shewanella vesiculosa]UJL44378.1 hypothetical protein KDH10_001875 [Shewanella vesiculosa]
MIKAHLEAVEEQLLATSKIPANSGHSLHKGTPREAFIKEFLVNHLSETVSIGTGEIVDCDSKPNEQRNQFDIVIYKKNYPKLDFGGGISGFLAESVVATIEVKSTLDNQGLIQSINAARNAKGLKQNLNSSFSTGWLPPTIMNYVVAYAGPAQMQTVFGWLGNHHIQNSIAIENAEERCSKKSPSLDGIFVLGKGFIKFDNSPTTNISAEIRQKYPDINWSITDIENGSLLMLFLSLLEATNNIQGAWLDPLPYLKNVRFHKIAYA